MAPTSAVPPIRLKTDPPFKVVGDFFSNSLGGRPSPTKSFASPDPGFDVIVDQTIEKSGDSVHQLRPSRPGIGREPPPGGLQELGSDFASQESGFGRFFLLRAFFKKQNPF